MMCVFKGDFGVIMVLDEISGVMSLKRGDLGVIMSFSGCYRHS